MKRSLFFLLFLLFPLSAQDDQFDMNKLKDATRNPMEYSEEKSIEAREEISPVIVVFRIAGSLAMLSALIVAVVWGIKKAGVAGRLPVSSDQSLELLEELTTGQNNSVVLVRFRDSVLLLGQTGSSMTELGKVEGAEALEIISQSAGGRSVGSFRANLNKYVGSLQKGSGRA
jgi:flagellar biogenesis protein FliO